MSLNFAAIDAGQKAVARELIDVLRANLIMYRTAKIQPVPLDANSKTVVFRGFNKLSTVTTPLTEGVVPTGSNPTLNTVSVTLAQYGSFVYVTDVAEFLWDRNLIEDTAELLGVQATETIDTLIFNVVGAGTSVVYGDGSVGARASVTSTMKMTSTLITRSVRFLERNNVKKFPSMPVIGNGYVTVAHPDVLYDIRLDSNFINAVNYSSPTPDNSMRGDFFAGTLGYWMGSRIVQSTLAPVYAGAGSGGINVYGVLTYGDGAYGVSEIEGGIQTIIKEGGAQDTSNPLSQYSTVGWKWMGAAAILDNNRIVRNEVAVTLSAATA